MGQQNVTLQWSGFIERSSSSAAGLMVDLLFLHREEQKERNTQNDWSFEKLRWRQLATIHHLLVSISFYSYHHNYYYGYCYCYRCSGDGENAQTPIWLFIPRITLVDIIIYSNIVSKNYHSIIYTENYISWYQYLFKYCWQKCKNYHLVIYTKIYISCYRCLFKQCCHHSWNKTLSAHPWLIDQFYCDLWPFILLNQSHYYLCELTIRLVCDNHHAIASR